MRKAGSTETGWSGHASTTTLPTVSTRTKVVEPLPPDNLTGRRRRREIGEAKHAALRDLHARFDRRGLEQDFNSLDNQREASEAYIKSQAHEGWTLIRDRYDDGGYSGGSMERPALQRLIGDVRANQLDIIVVYKVDRLTRSLADFAKLVDLFRRGQRVVHLGDPGLQHDDQHGPIDP